MMCIAALLCLAKIELLSFPCLSISSFFPFSVCIFLFLFNTTFSFCTTFLYFPFFSPYFSSSTPCFSIFSLFQSTFFILLITILLVIQDC
ncbi:hypothetical protein BDF14DRAFT_1846924 [Spinellus fusiger]|nr:hypothetical protein BDF14DRAFT_1846924 [Spinellus fusiger]